MKHFSSFGQLALLSLPIFLGMAACHKTPSGVAAAATQAGTQDQASDPASANLVPVGAPKPSAATSAGTPSTNPATAAPATQSSAQQSSQSNSPAPVPCITPAQEAQQQQADNGGAQPVASAPEAPPPLPEYEQPAAPADGYLWTPGYWNYASAGYFWVPGAWVEPPYMGALWTPGYWGFWNNRYGFYRGYWGPHIGYYGGINYGFGYIGFGYQGGYWGGGHFNYNRSVNNINTSVIHNTYSRSVVGNTNNTRISFNGGQGGLQVHARPEEIAGARERHSAPLAAQVHNEQAARGDHNQFASVNHGRPANAAVKEPLAANRNERAPEGAQRDATRGVGREPARQSAPTHPDQPNMQRGQQARQPSPQRQAAPQRQQAPQRQAAPQRQTAPHPQRQAAPQRSQPAARPQEERHPK
jgi:hypothetical protein